MNDLEKILWTTAGTITGGVLVFVIGQVATQLFIKPIYELRMAIGKIADALIFHAPNYRSEDGKVQDLIRQKASELLARASGVPFYPVVWFVSMGMIPSKRSILKASRGLIGLSNDGSDIGMWRGRICKALGLKLGFSVSEMEKGKCNMGKRVMDALRKRWFTKTTR